LAAALARAGAAATASAFGSASLAMTLTPPAGGLAAGGRPGRPGRWAAARPAIENSTKERAVVPMRERVIAPPLTLSLGRAYRSRPVRGRRSRWAKIGRSASG